MRSWGRPIFPFPCSPHWSRPVTTSSPSIANRRAPAGRGQQERPSPVAAFAASQGLPVATPKSLRNAEAQAAFAALDLDAAVVAAYGLILPKAVLDAPRLGCFNVHASLLPRWRGAAPIQRAILAGDSESGVTIMRMDEGLDTGAMLLTERVTITPDMNAGGLHDALSAVGSTLMVRALADVEAGRAVATPQPGEGITYAAKIDKAETRIDWLRSAVELERQARAFAPVPGAWFEYQGKQIERIRILAARVEKGSGTPGTVLDDRLLVACGDRRVAAGDRAARGQGGHAGGGFPARQSDCGGDEAGRAMNGGRARVPPILTFPLKGGRNRETIFLCPKISPSPLRAGLSHMSDDGEQEGIVPSCALDFASDGGLVWVAPEEVEGELSHQSDVLGAVVLAVAGSIFVEHDIENPMELVLDAPVACGDREEPFRREGFGEQEVSDDRGSWVLPARRLSSTRPTALMPGKPCFLARTAAETTLARRSSTRPWLGSRTSSIWCAIGSRSAAASANSADWFSLRASTYCAWRSRMLFAIAAWQCSASAVTTQPLSDSSLSTSSVPATSLRLGATRWAIASRASAAQTLTRCSGVVLRPRSKAPPQRLAIDRDHAPDLLGKGRHELPKRRLEGQRVENAEHPAERVVARDPVFQPKKLPEQPFLRHAEVRHVGAALRTAQHRRQGDDQNLREIVPGVPRPRVRQLLENPRELLHPTPRANGSPPQNPSPQPMQYPSHPHMRFPLPLKGGGRGGGYFIVAANKARVMTRFRITVEYDGTGLSGWQRQDHVPSVQGALETAAARLADAPVEIFGAGRTDAGVHATGQVAHLDIEKTLGAEAVRDGLNFWLRETGGLPIVVRAAEIAPRIFMRASQPPSGATSIASSIGGRRRRWSGGASGGCRRCSMPPRCRKRRGCWKAITIFPPSAPPTARRRHR